VTRNRIWLWLGLLAAGCSVAYAATYNRVPTATFATASTNCGTETGNTCWVTDCNSSTNCTAGSGANAVMMLYNGSSWIHMADDAAGAFTSIASTTADTFTFDSDGNATVLDAATNDNAITITRADSGSVSFTCADDDTDALCIYDSGGAAAVQVGSGDTTSVTVVTDSTGDDEVILPNSTIGPDEVGANMLVWGIFCGDLPNNTTNYTSPVTGYASGPFYAGGLTANDLDYTLAGTGCAAEDNTTEATADEVMFADVAAKVVGMYCQVTGSGSNGVTLHVRTAAGATTPDVTCTIATATTGCFAATPTTTDIAAGATVAVSAVTTEDLSTQDYWCMVQFALQD